jgi:predicted adenine nucleotide alpha hydrolase (AANH) superfamily ATPase
MNILLHICCGPCAIYPLKALRTAGHGVTGLFFNHNIHPYQEFRRRADAALQFAATSSLELIMQDDYQLEEFLGAVAAEPSERCRYCYVSRLEVAAREAAQRGFGAFTSTLLYSRYQNHDLIRSEGERLGQQFGIRFHYEDYRPGWHEGIRLSKEMGLYRQQYCGCIYSEKERYLGK